MLFLDPHINESYNGIGETLQKNEDHGSMWVQQYITLIKSSDEKPSAS